MTKKLFGLVILLAFLIPGFLSAEPPKAKVGFIPIMNSTGDVVFDALCMGMNDTLTVAFVFLKQFDLEVIPGIDPFTDQDEAVRYYKLKKLDYVIYGRATLTDNDQLSLNLAVYDRAEDKISFELKEDMKGSLNMFETADSMIEEVGQTFSRIHLGFGTLLLRNTGVEEDIR